jgi:hypothetical protein
MSRISGMNYTVTVGDTMIQVDTCNLTITDNSPKEITANILLDLSSI